MLAVDSVLHVQDPTKDGRVLVSGAVLEVADGRHVVEFREARFAAEAEQGLLVFFQPKRDFLQQSARILTLEPGGDGLRLVLELVGEPVSAESREHFRVPTAAGDYTVSLDGRDGCPMVDVSLTGFAAIAGEGHDVGAEIRGGFDLDGRTYQGPMVIQSVRDLGRGRVRYGLRHQATERDPEGLPAGVRALALQAEREMLRRVSGRD